MKYLIDIEYYADGAGYSHTETIETGNTDREITATEWAEGVEDLSSLCGNGEYIVIKAKLYEEDADPMFADPIKETEVTVADGKIQ